MRHALSKSSFLTGLQCHKALWLLKNRPELAREPEGALLAIFEQGQEVGKLAQGLFAGGVEVGFDDDREKMMRETAGLMAGGEPTIYEATFSHDNVLVMVDILHKGEAGWEIYEVKSGTSVKEINIWDVAVQYYVLSGAGIDITRASLVHINSSYVRRGDIDIHGLFTIEDMTDEARRRQESVRRKIEEMRAALGHGCPDIDIGPHCRDPYECDFIPHCWAHVPSPSVFEIHRLGSKTKFDLYYRGVVEFRDLPGDLILNARQKMQVDAEIEDRTFLDRDGIRAFLDTLNYPMYFLDFETFQKAVPPFDGTRPYEQIPFQFSLHVLERENAPLVHHEFLAEPGLDPREEIERRLARLVPATATVIAYNLNFEKRIIEALADMFPGYRTCLLGINENMRDLMVPFSKGFLYTKEMNGSASLKAVLPALVPELGYDGLAISGGQEASAAYASLSAAENPDEIKRVKKALLEYCRLDTLAMVKLVEKLRMACKTRPATKAT